jgi:hypothetical protein
VSDDQWLDFLLCLYGYVDYKIVVGLDYIFEFRFSVGVDFDI